MFILLLVCSDKMSDKRVREVSKPLMFVIHGSWSIMAEKAQHSLWQWKCEANLRTSWQSRKQRERATGVQLTVSILLSLCSQSISDSGQVFSLLLNLSRRTYRHPRGVSTR